MTGPAGTPGDKGDKGDKGDPGDPAPQFPATPFTGSILMSAQQQALVNGWVGTPFRTWKLCYRLSTDGASSATYHTNCDNAGATVAVVSTNTGRLLGGYSPLTGEGSTGYYPTDRSFLFSLTSSHRYPLLQAAQQYAIFHDATLGPTFGGGHDLMTNPSASNGYCYLGYGYGCHKQPSGTTDNACAQELCGANVATTFGIVDMEVFYEADDAL